MYVQAPSACTYINFGCLKYSQLDFIVKEVNRQRQIKEGGKMAQNLVKKVTKMTRKIVWLMLVFAMALSGCSRSTTTDASSDLNAAGPLATSYPAAAEGGCLLPQTPPPYLGMWSLESEDGPQMVVFTETSFYWVVTGKTVSEDGGTRERYAEVTAIDVEKQRVTLMTKWIRVNGDMVGYDSPQVFLTYRVEDGKLSFATSTEGFPAEVGTEEYTAK